MVSEKNKRIQITIRKTMNEKLERYCEERGYTKSVAIDMALEKFLKGK